MDYLTIILTAANKVGVSGSLLFAICSHESGNFTDIHVHNDGGTPSYGICMVKLGTAQLLGYKGDGEGLMDHETNALYAAKYLKYQSERYGQNWLMITSAYNAGSYLESTKNVGCPKNLKYVQKVQANLSENLKIQLHCEKQ